MIEFHYCNNTILLQNNNGNQIMKEPKISVALERTFFDHFLSHTSFITIGKKAVLLRRG